MARRCEGGRARAELSLPILVPPPIHECHRPRTRAIQYSPIKTFNANLTPKWLLDGPLEAGHDTLRAGCDLKPTRVGAFCALVVSASPTPNAVRRAPSASPATPA